MLLAANEEVHPLAYQGLINHMVSNVLRSVDLTARKAFDGHCVRWEAAVQQLPPQVAWLAIESLDVQLRERVARALKNTKRVVAAYVGRPRVGLHSKYSRALQRASSSDSASPTCLQWRH